MADSFLFAVIEENHWKFFRAADLDVHPHPGANGINITSSGTQFPDESCF